MKELINALIQASENRLKAPFLGSFILSWIAVNHIVVIEFLFSSSANKILLVKNGVFDPLMDVIIPLLVALVYTFGLPFLQGVIDKIKHKYVDGKRIIEHHWRRELEFKAQMKASEFQAKASYEYQQEKLKRDLNNWESQKEEFISRIDNLNSQIDTSTEQLDSIKAELEHKTKDLSEAREQVELLQEENKANQKQFQDASIVYEQYKETEEALKQLRESQAKTKEGLEQAKENNIALEKLALQIYDNMIESDEQIRTNLNAELKHRANFDSNTIEVISSSFESRVKKQRDKIITYRPMISNLRNRSKKRERLDTLQSN
ncbi:hypothetical protein [Aliivibrio fischeri]|uniref:hypothetical protein n=1 Tax=Aliivibrio fischeri TaxID=668 RepID=UPI0035510878